MTNQNLVKQSAHQNLIIPNWNAPANVRAVMSTRVGGVSKAPYNTLNLALHVGDNIDDVAHNRKLFKANANLPGDPVFISQVHGTDVYEIKDNSYFNVDTVDKVDSVNKIAQSENIIADASITVLPNKICAVLTADCLPVLLCDTKGHAVSAIHAGWRGLAAGVIESTVQKFHRLSISSDSLIAWLGPAIGPNAFKVRNDLKSLFNLPKDEEAFVQISDTEYLFNIYKAAILRLNRLGITQIFSGDANQESFCTYSDEARFFSYRRSPVTGRMISAIWKINTHS